MNDFFEMNPLLWSNSGVMTRRDPSPPALSGEGSRSTSTSRVSLCNSVVSASMSATSSFVGKAIAQKVSVKSTKASTTVRASAVAPLLEQLQVKHAPKFILMDEKGTLYDRTNWKNR